MPSQTPRVFISYSHDSPEHAQHVLELAERLRKDGVDAQLDQYVAGTPPEGWPRWMLNQLDWADFVLMVCTETYYRRFRGHEEPGKGKGADWEGNLITLETYDAKSTTTKFVPVLFDGQNERFIPEPLRGHTQYLLNSEENYTKLYAFLTGQAGATPGELGSLKALARNPVESLRFDVSNMSARQLPLSNLPDRNPFFTGREQVLTQLREALAAQGRAALSGLGGVGKTQTAVEYAHKHLDEYVHTLWASADSREALVSSYVTVAGLLKLPEADGKDQMLTVEAVKRWLGSTQGWLLILDNADDLGMVRAFIPSGKNGHVILTTRAQAAGAIARRVEIQEMGTDEGALFVLRRTKYIAEDAQLEVAEPTDRATAKEITMQLDGLPLALDQAGAYIEETSCGLSSYLRLHREHAPELLRRRGVLTSDHPNPVATTWALSFEKIEQANPAAAELLRFCAFLDPPDGIPEEVFRQGAPELGPVLGAVASDTLAWNDALSEILKYSLLRRDPNASTLEIHRLVQAVLKQGMDEATHHLWAERAVRALAYKVHPDTISPDGKCGIIYCSNPAVVRYENSRMRNYVVSLMPFRIIGALEGDVYFAFRNRSNLSVTWTDDRSSALVTVDGRWGPRSVVLIEIVNGKLVRQTNLLEKAIALLRCDCESCKSEPYNEHFLFVIVTQHDVEWSFDGDNRVCIDCTGESNPKQLSAEKSWAARLQAVWDIKQASFIQTKVSRILCGYYLP